VIKKKGNSIAGEGVLIMHRQKVWQMAWAIIAILDKEPIISGELTFSPGGQLQGSVCPRVHMDMKREKENFIF
jgi:hypothetical protein